MGVQDCLMMDARVADALGREGGAGASESAFAWSGLEGEWVG